MLPLYMMNQKRSSRRRKWLLSYTRDITNDLFERIVHGCHRPSLWPRNISISGRKVRIPLRQNWKQMAKRRTSEGSTGEWIFLDCLAPLMPPGWLPITHHQRKVQTFTTLTDVKWTWPMRYLVGLALSLLIFYFSYQKLLHGQKDLICKLKLC